MNIAVLPDSPATAPQMIDPLDHLADKLFHRMGPTASTPAPHSMRGSSRSSPR